VWRSLVARSVRVGEVPSSNLGTPINMGETMFPPWAPFFLSLKPLTVMGLRRSESGCGRKRRLSDEGVDRVCADVGAFADQ
jgi:hypothetical protein